MSKISMRLINLSSIILKEVVLGDRVPNLSMDMTKEDQKVTEFSTSTETDSKKRKLEDETPNPNKKQSTTETEQIDDEEDEEEIRNVPKELVISLEDISLKDIPSISMKANKYIKTILYHWDSTSKGNKESSDLLLDTKKSLFPMLVQLRKHNLEESQLTSLLTILYHLQRSQYNKALESYMKLSIGNVAWPIGVVSVSIHARSRDSKLFGGKANIMIDEKTRRWITAMKRLITYSEKNLQ